MFSYSKHIRVTPVARFLTSPPPLSHHWLRQWTTSDEGDKVVQSTTTTTTKMNPAGGRLPTRIFCFGGVGFFPLLVRALLLV